MLNDTCRLYLVMVTHPDCPPHAFIVDVDSVQFVGRNLPYIAECIGRYRYEMATGIIDSTECSVRVTPYEDLPEIMFGNAEG